MKKLTPDPAVTQEKLKVLDGKLAIYDFILGKQKYLAGEVRTLLDFATFCSSAPLLVLFFAVRWCEDTVY